jgi:hypothetical protein
MEVKDSILEGLNEVQSALKQAVDGLSQEELMWQPQPGANHIAYILWHTLRVEDWFFQYMFQRTPQVWESEKRHEKLNLPDDPRITGFGYTAEQVDGFPAVKLSDLLGYGEAVRARTLDYLRQLDAAKFDEIVQSRIFGEVRMGNLLSHLICEIAQHVGQIAYIRGLAKGQGK